MDRIAQQLRACPADSAIWLGYGCGGQYRMVSAGAALAALTERYDYGSGPEAPALYRETRTSRGLTFPYISARWRENCVCVVILPRAWSFAAGEPETML